MKRTPLKRTKGINPISKRRTEEIKQEIAIRGILCNRAGGVFGLGDSQGQFSYVCRGGKCEECGKPSDFRGLHPHEKVFRSQGGKLSLENSVMLCGKCHSAKHGVREV